MLPTASPAQVTWIGTGPNSNFNTAGNWQGGNVPPNTGADSATFETPGVSTSTTITLNTNANLSGITLQSLGSNYTDFSFYAAGGTLTIGTGGISSSGAGYGNGYFDVPIVLAGNQNWGSIVGQTIDVYGSGISGSGNLTLNGNVYLDSNLTFSGGITLASGYLDIGSAYGGNNTFGGGINVQSGALDVYNYNGVPNPAGTGTITLAAGTSLNGYYANLSNPITLQGNTVNLGSYASFGYGLTLSGPITATSSLTTIDLEYDSSVSVTGSIIAPTSSALTISGNGAQLPYDQGSQLVFEGALNQTVGVTVNGAALILAPSGAVSSAYPHLSPTGLQVNNGYLGLDGSFATTTGAVSTFIGTYVPGASGLGNTINGTLGFDSYNDISIPGGTNTFSDPINLTNFVSPNFLGLGSSSTAILAGTITPTSANVFPFGGGGGTLTVTSNLSDSSGTALVMNAGPAPLSLILQGTNTYTGGTTSNGGVLIFDSSTPATGTIMLNGGYVGYTENAANISTASDFIGQIQVSGEGGIIGFDSANSGSPRSIADPIDLSAYNSDNNPFIGTATSVTLTGPITPAANTYQFTGVKGGDLTVATNLTGASSAVVVGLVTPIEANGSNSVVNLTGTNNTYAGGTVFNSGTLFITGAHPLGSGPISVPDVSPYSGFVPYLAPFNGGVTLNNSISIGSIGSGPGLQAGNFYSTDMLTLNGVISDYPESSGILGIDGPVTLTQANTYTGGTSISGNYSNTIPVFVGNNAAFGTGQVNVNSQADITPLGGPVTLANPIQLNSTLTLGQSGNSNVLTLNGVISGTYSGYNLNINGPVDINAANTFPGSTYINQANVIIGSGASLGTGNVYVDNANVVIDAGGSLGTGLVSFTQSSVTENISNPAYLDLVGDSGSSIGLIPGATLTLNTDTTAEYYDYSGSINGNGTDQVAVAGTGIEYLGGTSTYGGGTTVVSGRLIAGSGAALGTGAVTVDSGAGLGVANPTVLTNSITLMPGAAVGGDGTFSPVGGLSISGGGTKISPGSDGVFASYVGNLSFGTALTFGSGGKYVFDVQDANGGAGTGYDTLTGVGAPATLTISATPGSPFTIAVESVTPGGYGALGPAANFNPSMSYSWTLLSAFSISGFNSADFSINLSGFQNSLAGGSFSVGESLNTLTLNFTPVPEPSTWALMAGGLGVVIFVGFRRTRRV
jgi:hypothetical protein